MNVEEEFKKFLYEWVKKNFGQSEADDPSWSIEALAHDLREEYIKIKEREETEWVKEDVEYVANNHDIKLTDKQAYAVAQEYMLSEAYCEMHAEDILWFIQREKEKEKPVMTEEQLNTYKKLQELDGMMGTNKSQEYADGISKGNKTVADWLGEK
jgi:hypothetical protein